MKYLVVNKGSASEKYAIYDGENRLAFLHLETSDGGCNFVGNLFVGEIKEEKCITKKEFKNSLNYAVDLFISKNIIKDKKEISGIGIRIVAPGDFFYDDKKIDKEYEKEIKKAIKEAPLHLAPAYDEILKLKKVFKSVPIVGVSDSDFHDTMPDKAKLYPISKEDTQKFNLKRHGYHGTSIESILEKIKKEKGGLPSKMIVCHIGGGVSVTAIKDGKSIDTSMGFTPLEGVMMATRGGDIDPGAIAKLSEKFVFRPNAFKQYLNKNCGLLGVSGKSSDVRDLIKLEKDGDKDAKLALDMYAYKIQKYIGGYFVALGGLDALVFSATVGERSFVMREKICSELGVLGVKINIETNNKSDSVDVDISAVDSKVKVWVVKTDEMNQIAKDTIRILS